MQEKICNAQNLRKLYKSTKLKYHNTNILPNMFIKCYFLYIMNCIVLKKENFKLKLKVKYNKNIFLRCYDWIIFFIHFITNYIGTFILKHCKRTKNLYTNHYAYYMQYIMPIHFKTLGNLIEYKFSYYLERFEFYIKDDVSFPTYITYTISAKVN